MVHVELPCCVCGREMFFGHLVISLAGLFTRPVFLSVQCCHEGVSSFVCGVFLALHPMYELIDVALGCRTHVTAKHRPEVLHVRGTLVVGSGLAVGKVSLPLVIGDKGKKDVEQDRSHEHGTHDKRPHIAGSNAILG